MTLVLNTMREVLGFLQKIGLALLALVWASTNMTCFAQASPPKEVVRQGQYWIRYYATINLNSKLSWHNEFDSRYFFANGRQATLITHTRLAYKPNDKFSLAAALCYSRQRPQDAFAAARPVTPELRPWQEFNFNQRLSARWALGYRLRTEERFIENRPGPFDSNFRFSFATATGFSSAMSCQNAISPSGFRRNCLKLPSTVTYFTDWTKTGYIFGRKAGQPPVVFRSGVHENIPARPDRIEGVRPRQPAAHALPHDPAALNYFCRSIVQYSASRRVQAGNQFHNHTNS